MVRHVLTRDVEELAAACGEAIELRGLVAAFHSLSSATLCGGKAERLNATVARVREAFQAALLEYEPQARLVLVPGSRDTVRKAARVALTRKLHNWAQRVVGVVEEAVVDCIGAKVDPQTGSLALDIPHEVPLASGSGSGAGGETRATGPSAKVAPVRGFRRSGAALGAAVAVWQSFRAMLQLPLPAVQRRVRQLHLLLIEAAHHEVKEVRLVFRANKDEPPALPNYPLFAGRACWCKSLEDRLEDAMAPVMTLFPQWGEASDSSCSSNDSDSDAGPRHPEELECVPYHAHAGRMLP